MKAIKINASFEHARVASLSDNQVHGPVHTTHLEDDCTNYGSDIDVMVIVVKKIY